jgi:hypothetical protein
MLTDTIKWVEINLKVLDTINDNRSVIGSTEDGPEHGRHAKPKAGGVRRNIYNVYVPLLLPPMLCIGSTTITTGNEHARHLSMRCALV